MLIKRFAMIAAIILLTSTFFVAGLVSAWIPEPSNIIYGVVRDSSGKRITKGTISLEVNGYIVTSCSINGLNFLLDVPIVSANPYDEVEPQPINTAKHNDIGIIKYNNQPVTNPTSGITLGARGSIINQDVIIAGLITCYQDSDYDQYGNPNAGVIDSPCPAGYVNNNEDCDDSDSYVHPGAQEFCDGKDNDCDSVIPPNETLDADIDGVVACNDCDDNDSGRFPGNQEICDNKDNNCNGTIDEGCFGDCMFKAAIVATGQQISGGSEYVSTVFIGIDNIATTSPYLGPPLNYTVTMEIEESLLEDYRLVGSEREEWSIIVHVEDDANYMLGGFFPVLSWDNYELCPSNPNNGRLSLYSDVEGIRTLLVEDMTQVTQYQTKEEDGECDLNMNTCVFNYFIVWSKEITIDMTLPIGWSMISLPLMPTNPAASELFPGAVVLYGYEKGKGYIRVANQSSIEPGTGYWILLNSETTFTLSGQPIPIDGYTFEVEDRWYMIGGCTNPAQPSVNNGNIMVIYKYIQQTGYKRIQVHENLEPGIGYWILFSGTQNQGQLSVGNP